MREKVEEKEIKIEPFNRWQLNFHQALISNFIVMLAKDVNENPFTFASTSISNLSLLPFTFSSYQTHSEVYLFAFSL